MPERRYRDSEIAAIFRAAADGPQAFEREVSAQEGLTLPELQAIGREVGLSADAVARAALALDTRPVVTSRAFLGLPLGVASTVDLHRQLTDDEWWRFVGQLREVFGARGQIRSDGPLRQWTNGNLHVLLEPTESGHRLRFGTTHGGARASIGAGLGVMAIAGIGAIITASAGTLGEATVGLATVALAGAGLIANGLVRLPGWARRRAQQMAALGTSLASGSRVLPPTTDPVPPSEAQSN